MRYIWRITVLFFLKQHVSAIVDCLSFASTVSKGRVVNKEKIFRSILKLSSSPGDSWQPFSPFHHVALKTRNITLAVDFYSLLGFELEVAFRTGSARAAWLKQPSSGAPRRIELIEVPSYLLRDQTDKVQRAPDLLRNPTILGYNHMAFDVTLQVHSKNNLQDFETASTQSTLQGWIDEVDRQSFERFGKHLRLALEPFEQMIGTYVYDVAFLYDADGSLLELLSLKAQVSSSEMRSGWEPLDDEVIDFLSSRL